MTSAAKLTLSMVFCAALSLTAQVATPQDAAQWAGEEAVRRQEKTIELHEKLAQAQEAQQKGRTLLAAQYYQEAVALFPDVQVSNPSVEIEKKQALLGLDAVRIKLTRDALAGGDLAAATDQVRVALQSDPTNQDLQKLKAEVDRMKVEQMGKVPSPDLVKTIPAYEKEKIDIGTQLQNAKLLYEMDKLDEAEAILVNVLRRDPGNKAAAYYMDLVKEARFMQKARAREMDNKQGILDVERGWVNSNKRDLLPIPNPEARTNTIYTTEGRQGIMAKLERIHLNEVAYDLPLTEVLKALGSESVKRDPEGTGINFMINSHAISTGNLIAPSDLAGAGGLGRGFEPPPQLGVTAVTPAPAVDMTQVTIHIAPPLHNLRLTDVLDAICKVADQPITYTVEDYAVVFAPKPPLEAVLYTRTFKVNPNTFVQGLQNVTAIAFVPPPSTGGTGGGGGGGGGGQTGQQNNPTVNFPGVQIAPLVQGASSGGGGGGGGLTGAGGGGQQIGLRFVTQTNNTESLNDLVRDYFTAAGVNLTEPGKSVFFNDRNGILMVRASSEDLEIIAEAIETLDQPPVQLTIEAKFAELSQEDAKALGFQWLLGNTLLNNGTIGVQGGTAGQYVNPNGSAANSTGIFPYSSSPYTGGPQNGSPSEITSGLRQQYGPQNNPATTPTLTTISGIMTDPQFRVAINAIEQRTGADVLSAPKITTESGRQAHISAEEIQQIVTGVQIQTTGTAVTGTLGGSGTGVAAPQINYTPTPFAFGPVLDVLPTVSADGYSVQMVIIPTYTEFVGYDNPGAFVPTAQGAAGSTLGVPLVAVLPLPHFRVRELVTSCNVWDGQTVVLGGMISENITKIKDKVPVLGDLPLVGRLFQSQSSDSIKQNLLIFVTPTLIDPAGNRLHTEDEMPFAKIATTSIPPQPSATQP